MKLVTLSGLMESYGYSESWWRARVAEGLPKRKWGGRLRFDPAEVEQWLDDRYATLGTGQNRERMVA